MNDGVLSDGVAGHGELGGILSIPSLDAFMEELEPFPNLLARRLASSLRLGI